MVAVHEIDKDIVKDPCPFCREMIRSNAVKCRYCGAYNGWRHWLHQISIVLGVVIAAGTVFAMIFPLLQTYYRNANRLSFQLIDVLPTTFEIGYQHLGLDIVSVRDVTLLAKFSQLPNEHFKKTMGYVLLPSTSEDASLEPAFSGAITIKPQTHRADIESYYPAFIKAIDEQKFPDSCEVVFSIDQGLGSVAAARYPIGVDCSKAAEVLRNTVREN